VHEVEAFLAHGGGHDVSRLLLFVDLPAVGNGGALEEVDGPIGAIIEVPELLLVPGGFYLFILENFQEIRRFRKAGAGRRRSPNPRIMHRHVKAAASAESDPS